MKTNELINLGSNFLKEKNISSNRIDSEVILSHVIGISRERLLIDESNLENGKIKKFKSLLSRRSRSEPVAYILKSKEFRSLNIYVEKNSLIPRPETELLIDPLIKIFKNKSLFFLDVGVGTGCIALSILKELKLSRGIGIDISSYALKNAFKNLKQFTNRLKLYRRSIDNLDNFKFDLIISNPPYIVRRQINRLTKDIKTFEPRIAIDGGNDGLDVIKKVIYKSKNILKLNGILALEIGTGQYNLVMKLLEKNNFRKIVLVRDFNRNVRCIFSTLSKNIFKNKLSS